MSPLSSKLISRNRSESRDTDDQIATKIGHVITAFRAYQKAYSAYQARLADLPADLAEGISLEAGSGELRLSLSDRVGAVGNGTLSHPHEPNLRRMEQMEIVRKVLRGCHGGMHYRDITLRDWNSGARQRPIVFGRSNYGRSGAQNAGISLNGAINKCGDFEKLGSGFFRLKADLDQ